MRSVDKVYRIQGEGFQHNWKAPHLIKAFLSHPRLEPLNPNSLKQSSLMVATHAFHSRLKDLSLHAGRGENFLGPQKPALREKKLLPGRSDRIKI